MAIGRDDWIGLRVARYRDMAGMTAQQLADRIGVSRGYISAIENGLRPVTTRALLISLAEGLSVAVTDLTKAPKSIQTPDERALHAAVPAIRAALDGAEDLEPLPWDRLVSEVDRTMAARMACDYRALSTLLPETIARTLALCDVGGSERSHSLFARACITAALALRPLGYVDLAYRFAERAAGVAADGPTKAAADYARAQSTLSGGVRGLRARSLMIARVGAEAVQADRSDEGQSWYGLLNLQAGLVAASLGRPDDAQAHIAEAAETASTVRSDSWRMEFTPANVGVWEVATLLESENHGRAPEVARKIDQTQLRTVQRKAHLYTHMGRALFMQGDHNGATRALQEADRIAPSEVRWRASVREIVGQMVRDVRREAGSPELRDLAVKVGVDPLAPEA